MKILSGVYTRDSGDIEIFGKKVEGDLNTKQAQELGVAIIHQELNMCQHLTVAANMFLGREIRKGAKLKNCIIFRGCDVGENACLSNVIADKHVVVSPETSLVGNEKLPVVIPKGSKI